MEIGSPTVVEPPLDWDGEIRKCLVPQDRAAQQGSLRPSLEGDSLLLPDPGTVVCEGGTHIRTHVRGILVNKDPPTPVLRATIHNLEPVLGEECGKIVSATPLGKS